MPLEHVTKEETVRQAHRFLSFGVKSACPCCGHRLSDEFGDTPFSHRLEQARRIINNFGIDRLSAATPKTLDRIYARFSAGIPNA